MPKRAARNRQQNKAQQENQNGLTPPSGFIERARVRKHPVDPDWIGDVLDFAISERLISADQFVLDLLVNTARNVNLAGIGNAFKARSNVDAIPINIILFDDNVAQVDTDPVLDPKILRQ